jgi:hypothetical protein
MFALKSIVISRQLDELRAEAAARRLARLPASDDEAPRPKAHRPWWTDDPSARVPVLTTYPNPAR